MDLIELLHAAVKNNASDVHLQAGAPPSMRIAGQIRSVKGTALTSEQVRQFVSSIAPESCREHLEESLIEGMDFSYTLADAARFRCSAYRHLGDIGIVMRIITTRIPTLEELSLPKVVHDIALSRRGVTLVTGTTGSGKSTTLAAMIGLINQRYRARIITVEDPIEFVHANDKALISQLEVHLDTTSFEHALRQSLRMDPDVILVGELRDVESLRTFLHAADTGHQVFSTVHSTNAAQTVERIISMFPPAEHKLLLSQLAGSLEAIISQRLVSTLNGPRVPAVEILRGNPVTEKLILDNRLDEIGDYIETGESGMQSFDQDILRLYRKDLISGTEAMRWASKPESLALRMRGIRFTGTHTGEKP